MPRPAQRPAGAAKRAPSARQRLAAVRSAPEPNAIGIHLQHMDYTSHDLEAVRRFYVEVLGFADAHWDAANQYLAVHTGPSSSLGFMPPTPGPPEQWRPPREPAIYLFVDDVDRAHDTLARKGVTFEQPPADAPWGHRYALLRDPEGRMVCLAHRLHSTRTRASRSSRGA